MGSMKSGIGDDPFTDENSDDVVDESTEESGASESEPVEESIKTESTVNSKGAVSEPEQSTDSVNSQSPSTQQPVNSVINAIDVVDSVPHEDERIPFIMSRQSVKGSRDGKILQIALNRDTQNYLEEAVRQIQREFDDDVKKMDISEAVLLAGLMNLGDVDSVLRKWGYDFQE